MQVYIFDNCIFNHLRLGDLSTLTSRQMLILPSIHFRSYIFVSYSSGCSEIRIMNHSVAALSWQPNEGTEKQRMKKSLE